MGALIYTHDNMLCILNCIELPLFVAVPQYSVEHDYFVPQDMVAAESRKVEQDHEMLKEVSLIHNNGRLLSEMLANKDTTSDEKLLLNELHKTCLELRPKLYRLAGQLSDRFVDI